MHLLSILVLDKITNFASRSSNRLCTTNNGTNLALKAVLWAEAVLVAF